VTYIINPYVTKLKINSIGELWYNPLNQEIVVLNFEDLKKIIIGKPPKVLVNNLFILEYDNLVSDHKILTDIWKSVVKSCDFVPKIEVAYFVLTERCNFACRYCFVKRGSIKHTSSSSKDMSKEVIDRGLELFALFVKNVTKPVINLYGGEPLLNFDGFAHILKRVEAMKLEGSLPQNTVVTLVSNGSLLNSETISLIKRYKVVLSISLDGPPNLNDTMRISPYYKSSSEVVINNLKRLSEENIWFTISCTITEYNIDKLDKVVEYFIRKLNCKDISLNIPIPTNKFSPDPFYLAKKMIKAYEIIRKYGGSEDRISRIIRPLVEGGIKTADCAGCGGQIVIAPDGSIGPCHAYLGFKKGHFVDFGLLTHDLNDVKIKIEKSKLFTAWARKSPLLNESCKGCKVFSLCGGGCFYAAKINNSKKDEYWCAYVKTAGNWILERIANAQLKELRKETENVFHRNHTIAKKILFNRKDIDTKYIKNRF
jgi:uncharacterized protein